MENVESLIIEHLRALRSGQERMEGKLTELTHRITSLETTLLKSRSDNLSTQDDV